MSTHESPLRVVAFGGGHGLFATLRALRALSHERSCEITAVVTVADDGGSSGRLRHELGCLPPGDLRQALVALSDDYQAPEIEVMQRRFSTDGPLNGHPVGNLLIASACEVYDNPVEALAYAAELFGARGRVLPMANEPLVIEADISATPETHHSVTVRGQAEVATAQGIVRQVRVLPENPAVAPELSDAVRSAEWLIFGPGSWFTSVLPHLLTPGVRDAIRASVARRLVILNLSTDTETSGWALEEHLHALTQHAPWLSADVVLADSQLATDTGRLKEAAGHLGAEVWCESLALAPHQPYHDTEKLAAVFSRLL